MPELPEVETARRGIEPHLLGHRIERLVVRNPNLRWPVPPELAKALSHQRIEQITRRAKYLLLHLQTGTIILHLGMSGSLRVLPSETPAQKHDHIDLLLDSGTLLRFHDPRRFGAFLWTTEDPHQHPLLAHLGPEPLSDAFDGLRLYNFSRGRRAPVKTFIMDNQIVVGLGNIYANESLFRAHIHPLRPAGRISRKRYDLLADAAKTVLTQAIEKGGTTLRDFTRADGNPGYFHIELKVYGHAGEPCQVCGATLKQTVIGQRSTFFCPRCQH